MFEQIILAILTAIFSQITSLNPLVIMLTVTCVLYFGFKLLKKKLPFVIVTRKTVEYIKNAVRSIDKDIVELNRVSAIQLDNIIVTGIKAILTDISNFMYSHLESVYGEVTQKKQKALIILMKSLTFELRDAVKQLNRENGFSTASDEDLKKYATSKEYMLYDIIERACNTDYLFNDEDRLFFYINNKRAADAVSLSQRIQEQYYKLFKNIAVHQMKTVDKINELMNHNETAIKEYL